MSDSYPPHLLRLPGSAPGSPARGHETVELGPQPATAGSTPDGGQQAPAPSVLLATPGQPGAYEPAVPAAERPRNVTEMQARATVATPEPWSAGAYVPMGGRGKRAHWTGSSWKGGSSPGYGAELATVRSEPEQTTEQT